MDFASLAVRASKEVTKIRITAAETAKGAQSANPRGAQTGSEAGEECVTMAHHRLGWTAEL